MKVLLTGATGFIGSRLAIELFDQGYATHILRRKGSNRDRIKSNLDGFLPPFHEYEVDLLDEKKLSKIIKQINPEVVYHFAANQASSLSSSAEDDIKTNIIGTWNLLKALKNCDVELIVNAGSSSEYGHRFNAMSEDDVLAPNSYHSFAKASQTNLVQTYGLVENKPVITLRFFSVYGPQERKTRLIPAVIDACLNRKDLKLSSPEVVRDFVYVDDVIGVCTKINELKKHTGQIFNIGTGKQTSIKQVVDIVSRLTGYEPKCLWNENQRSWDTNRWVSDCSKTERFWKYSTDIEQGLAKTIDWTKLHGK